MNLSWYKTDSEVRPQEVDTDSSSTLVYFRRNIREEQREEHGEVLTFYVYEESKLSRADYAIYAAEQNTNDIIAAEQEITEQDLSMMEAEQEITDLDLRLMELENAQEGANDEA